MTYSNTDFFIEAGCTSHLQTGTKLVICIKTEGRNVCSLSGQFLRVGFEKTKLKQAIQGLIYFSFPVNLVILVEETGPSFIILADICCICPKIGGRDMVSVYLTAVWMTYGGENNNNNNNDNIYTAFYKVLYMV